MKANSATISRVQLMYGLCLPLAALIGFFLADPLRLSTFTILGLIASILIWPLFTRWYHPLLVGSLHSVFVLSFLPGSPPLWFVVAFGGFLFVVFQRCLDARVQFFPPGGVGLSLLGIAGVVMVTGLVRGGVGLSALGSASMGGKKYIHILLAVASYFVLVTRPIPRKHAMIYMGLFCLSGFTELLSHLVYLGGGKFYWLYRFVSVSGALSQQSMEWDVQGHTLFRSVPMMNAASSLIGFMLAWFGVSGMANVRRPWRMAFVLGCVALGLFGGFRSFVLSTTIMLMVAFFLEGLHRTRYLMVLAAAGLIVVGTLATVSDKLPYSVQRSLSFLPIKVDERVRLDAQGSLDWRLEMWEILRGEIPEYLWLGKGYSIDPAALQMAGLNSHYGFTIQAEWAVLAGEYHNGPLSVLIPFGVWGVLAFAWFLVAGFLRLRALCRNADPGLATINRALCAMFITRIIFFLLFFGSLYSELVEFVILIGMAECLNAQPVTEEVPAVAWTETVEVEAEQTI